MKIRIVMICLVGLMLAAEPPADLLKTEKQKLEGTWILTSMEVDGETIDQLEGTKISFAGDKVTTQMGDMKNEGTYTLDPTKNPKQIDVVSSGKVKETTKGIYQLEGDELKICSGGTTKKVVNGKAVEVEQNDRPTQMDSKFGSIMTLRREKK